MQHTTMRVPVEAFDQMAAAPENADRLLEYIGGEVVEVPSNPYSSYISSILIHFLLGFVLDQNLGFVTGEQGGYMVSGERYAPDVAFLSFARQAELAKTGYNLNPPELAVEVLSPTDTESQMMIKVANYLAAGTIVWVIDPSVRVVHVFRPGQPVQTLTENDTLRGEGVLNGFEISVLRLFP